MSVDGEPYNPFGPLFTAGVINARDELAKCQPLLLGMGLHGFTISPMTPRMLWGVHPMSALIL